MPDSKAVSAKGPKIRTLPGLFADLIGHLQQKGYPETFVSKLKKLEVRLEGIKEPIRRSSMSDPNFRYLKLRKKLGKDGLKEGIESKNPKALYVLAHKLDAWECKDMLCWKCTDLQQGKCWKSYLNMLKERKEVKALEQGLPYSKEQLERLPRRDFYLLLRVLKVNPFALKDRSDRSLLKAILEKQQQLS